MNNPMLDFMLANYTTNCRHWTRIYTGLIQKPWWFTTPYELSANVCDVFFPFLSEAQTAPQPASGETGKGDSESLEETARRRLQKGYAPPREIYDVRNRERIDWASVPDWARAVDPEVFTGCAHEG